MKNISKLDLVYVLILNYQSYGDTIKYVGCLQKQENVNLNILIVDNCSPNGSYEILRNTFKDVSSVEVVKSEKNGGYAYGNNFGLRYLKDKNIDYIIISNNDIDLNDPMLISKLTHIYKKLNKPAFIAPVMCTNGIESEYAAWKLPTLQDDIMGSLRTTEILFGNRTKYLFIKDDDDMPVDCLPGSFFLGAKDIFFKLDLMDDNTFLYGEEVILAYKVKKAGLQNYLIKSLKYEHLISNTISKYASLFKMRKYLIDSRVYYHQKYFGVSKIKANFLKFLLQIWKVETIIYLTLKKFKKVMGRYL